MGRGTDEYSYCISKGMKFVNMDIKVHSTFTLDVYHKSSKLNVRECGEFIDQFNTTVLHLN